MTKKKHAAREHLKASALQIIREVWSGEWKHIQKKIDKKPLPKIRELTTELEKRSPGHELEDYQDVLSRALRDNR